MNIKRFKNKLFLLPSIAGFASVIPVISCSSDYEEYFNYDVVNSLVPNVYSFEVSQNQYQYSLYFDLEQFTISNQNNKLILSDFRVIDPETRRQLPLDLNQSKMENKKVNLKISKTFSSPTKTFFVRVRNEAIKSFLVKDIKSFKIKNFNQDKKYFFNLIKDISSNDIPLIIQARNSSIILQQAFYLSLINYYQNINNPKSKNFSVFNYENNSILENRFNASILKENNVWNGVTNIQDFNQDNISNFNLVRGAEILWRPYQEFANHINQIKSKFNIQSKVDFFIDSVRFSELVNDFIRNPKNSHLSIILKISNRIIVGSEGAAHSNVVIPNLIKNMQQIKLEDRATVIQKLNDYQSGKIETLEKNDLLNLLVLKNFETINENSKFDFINFINYDNNISNSINLKDDMMWNENPFSTNFVEYSKLIEDQDQQQQYLKVFSKLFLNTEFNLENIFVSGLETYDPKKRNAIFLGSSLFQPYGPTSPTNFSRLQKFPKLTAVVQERMKNLLEKFPPSEFNIIFKLHPVFSNENDPKNESGINYVKLITNNAIENPLIVNPKIPLETFIANNYYQYEIKNDTSNILFRENDKYKPWEWTTFFGFQATTTTIHTTRVFYQSSFNLSNIETSKLIPFSNFPIPVEFPVVARLEKDEPGNFYDSNYEQIKKIYQYYNPSLMFNNSQLSIYDSILLNF